jgi:hypothetical protein
MKREKYWKNSKKPITMKKAEFMKLDPILKM